MLLPGSCTGNFTISFRTFTVTTGVTLLHVSACALTLPAQHGRGVFPLLSVSRTISGRMSAAEAAIVRRRNVVARMREKPLRDGVKLLDNNFNNSAGGKN